MKFGFYWPSGFRGDVWNCGRMRNGRRSDWYAISSSMSLRLRWANEGAREITTLFIDSPDPQGQVTPKSEKESCRNSNSFKLWWLVLLPARKKKIHTKMKALEWSQHFSHYKSMGIFSDAPGQLTPQFEVWSCWISIPSEILWLSSIPARIKKNQSKMTELEWSQGFPHFNSMGAISCHGNHSSDPIWPKT